MAKTKRKTKRRGGVTEKPKKGFHRQNQALPAGQLTNHDSKYDLDTLTRAEEIRSSKDRHSAAISHGKRQHSVLSSVLSGASPKDEKEMQTYAKRRVKGKGYAVA